MSHKMVFFLTFTPYYCNVSFISSHELDSVEDNVYFFRGIIIIIIIVIIIICMMTGARLLGCV
jgi:hypothetical protein